MILYAKTPEGELERAQTLVGSKVGGSIIASMGVWKRLQIGLELPYTLFQYRPDPDVTKPGAALVGDQLQAVGFGDLRVSPKIALWRVDGDDAPIDIAIIPTVTLPTAALLNDVILGSGDTRWMGETSPTFAPELAVSRQLPFGLRLAGNLGYRLRFPTESLGLEVGSEAFYRAGVAYRFDELLRQPIEIGGSVGGQMASFDPQEANKNGSPDIVVGRPRQEGQARTPNIGDDVDYQEHTVGMRRCANKEYGLDCSVSSVQS